MVWGFFLFFVLVRLGFFLPILTADSGVSRFSFLFFFFFFFGIDMMVASTTAVRREASVSQK